MKYHVPGRSINTSFPGPKYINFYEALPHRAYIRLSTMEPLIRTHNPLPMDPSTNRLTKVAISRSSLDAIPTSIATASLGTPSDSLEAKLSAIASAGFQAVELGFRDLVSFASTTFRKEIQEDDFDNLVRAGKEVRKLCANHDLKIVLLQTPSRFEGWNKGSKDRDQAFLNARGWIRIIQSLGTDMLQVGSSNATAISTDNADIVGDLRELADMLSENQFRLAYENWAWSTHAYALPFSYSTKSHINTFVGRPGRPHGML